MSTLSALLPKPLQFVTGIAQSVSHRDGGVHRSRTTGHVGTGNTLLLAPKAQSAGGKHRAGAL